MYMYPFSPNSPPIWLPHNVEQSSMCCIVGFGWLSILNIAACVCPWFRFLELIHIYWSARSEEGVQETFFCARDCQMFEHKQKSSILIANCDRQGFIIPPKITQLREETNFSNTDLQLQSGRTEIGMAYLKKSNKNFFKSTGSYGKIHIKFIILTILKCTGQWLYIYSQCRTSLFTSQIFSNLRN